MFDSFIVYAQTFGSPCPSSGPIKNPLGNLCTVQDLVNKLLEIVVQVGIPVLVVAIVYVGFKFVAARGNPEELKEAKRAFLAVIIGAAIILGAYIISSAISGTIDSLR